MIVNVEIKANNGAWELTDPASVQAKYTAISDVFPSGADQEGGTGKLNQLLVKILVLLLLFKVNNTFI